MPATGSFALDAVTSGGLSHLAASSADVVRPMASVTKAMTALVILEAHPLQGGDPGPVLTINATDVADYTTIAAAGGSFAPVVLGEQLTERDLLLGIMLPSANNLALTAARWVDGSVAGFVARLNARAASLGMGHTHFADPDGLDAATTSTAADLVRLGEAAVDSPAFVSVVSKQQAMLPDGTVVHNLNQLLSEDAGWIGVKTGWTPAADGCLLFALRRSAGDGGELTVVGAVLAQPPDPASGSANPELGGAFDAARSGVQAVLAGYATVRVGRDTLPVDGSLTAPWGDRTRLELRGADHVVLVRRGDPLTVTTRLSVPEPPVAAGAEVGSVTVTAAGATVGRWSLVASEAVAGPALGWRLLND